MNRRPPEATPSADASTGQLFTSAPPRRSRVLRVLSMGCELQGAVDATLAWAKESLDAARRQDGQRPIRDAQLSVGSVGIAHSRAGDVKTKQEFVIQVIGTVLAQAAAR